MPPERKILEQKKTDQSEVVERRSETCRAVCQAVCLSKGTLPDPIRFFAGYCAGGKAPARKFAVPISERRSSCITSLLILPTISVKRALNT